MYTIHINQLQYIDIMQEKRDNYNNYLLKLILIKKPIIFSVFFQYLLNHKLQFQNHKYLAFQNENISLSPLNC